jgi:hypothetical protein
MMERLKRYDITGISDEDMHDKKVMKSYREVTEEFIKRWEQEVGVTNNV